MCGSIYVSYDRDSNPQPKGLITSDYLLNLIEISDLLIVPGIEVSLTRAISDQLQHDVYN